MKHRFEIKGRLMGLNEYINEQRRSPITGAAAKETQTNIVAWSCKKIPVITKQVDVYVDWYVGSKRMDKDNIYFAIKFILDGLVTAGRLKDDGWKEIRNIYNNAYVDRYNAHVEVTLVEIDDENNE